MTHRYPLGVAWSRTAPGVSGALPVVRTPRRVIIAILAVIMMVFGAMATAPSAHAQNYVSPVNNPAMPERCGLNIALVFDLSGSLSDSDVANSKAAGVAVAEGLKGTPTNIGVYSFATFAPATNNTNLGKTSVSTQTGVDTVKNAVHGLQKPPSNVAGTNWDAGLRQLQDQEYDVVYFVTDGRPTAYGTPGSGGNNDFGTGTDFNDVNEAIKSANVLKEQDTRIVPLGVGSGIDVTNLERISGDGDYKMVSNYANLVNDLKDEVTKYCRGEINITKQIVDQHGGVTQEAAADWEFSVSDPTEGITLVDPTTASTGADGKVQFRYNTDMEGRTGAIKVTETVKDGSTFKNVQCTDRDGANVPVSLENNSFVVPASTRGVVNCVASNTLSGKLKVTKEVIGDNVWDKDFTITAVCHSGTVETFRKDFQLAAGASETVDVPAGSTCVVSEEAETHQVVGYTLQVDVENNDGLIKAGATHQTTVKNEYSRDLGGLTVTKKVEGYNSDDKTYAITATCTAEGAEDVVRTANLKAGESETFTDIPTGMSCVVAEDEGDAEVEDYTLAVSYTQHEGVIVKGENRSATVTNNYTRDTGGLTVTKKVEGYNSGDKTYAVTTVCSIEGAEVFNKTVDLKAGESGSFADIPTGATCVVSEDEDDAEVEGYDLDVEVTQHEGVISKGETRNATVTNTYSRHMGGLEVTKVVAGDLEFGDRSYNVTATCTIDGETVFNETATLTANEPTKAWAKVPTGATCEVVEDMSNVEVDNYDHDVTYAQPSIIVKDEVSKATVTNTYERTNGDLVINKVVDGPFGDQAYSVTAVCTLDGTEVLNETVELTAGTPAEFEVPIGAECEVTEDEQQAAQPGYSLDVTVDPEGKFAIADAAGVTVTVTNAYSALDASVKIEKLINEDEASATAPGTEVAPGEDMTVTYTVTNTGEVTLTDIAVSDLVRLPEEQLIEGITCDATELAPGESTTCTHTIAAPADFGAEHHNVATVTAKTPLDDTVTDDDEAFAFTPRVGGFTIAKSLKADMANEAAPWAEKTFTFDYSCQFGDEPAIKGELELKPGELENVVETLGELKVGTKCTVTERDAAVENFDWTTEWDVKGANDIVTEDNSTSFTIGTGDEGQAVAIGVKNIYTAETGSFDIVKTISGEAAAAAASQQFEFDYACAVGDEVVASGTTSLVGAGTVTVDGIPLIADCTVSEKPVNVKDTALNVTITPDEFRLIDNPDGVTVTVDNEFTYVDGGLIISKFVTGDAVSHAPDEFTVNYRCVAPTYGDDAAPVPPATTEGTEGVTEEEPPLEDELQEILDGTNLNDADIIGNDDEEDESFAAAVLNTLTDVEGVTLGDDNLLATGQVQEGTVTLTNGKSVVIEGIIPGSECEVWEDPAPAKIRPGFLGSGGKPGADWNVEYTLDGQPAGEPVQFTIEAGANSQVIVENQYSKTEENGLIIIPIPIPIPGDGGSSILPGGPGSSLPGGSSTPDGSSPGPQTPAQPGTPAEPGMPGKPGQPGQAAPVKEQPAKAAPALAVTGANVLWAGGIALLLMAFGVLFVVRARRNEK